MLTIQDTAQSLNDVQNTVAATGDSVAVTAIKTPRILHKRDSSVQASAVVQPVNVTVVNSDTGIADHAEHVKQVSFFTGHELKAGHKTPLPLNKNTPDWIFPLVILMVAAFAWLRAFYNKYFLQVVSAFFNNNLANQIVRDENILVQRASILLNLVFSLVVALFLYFVSIHFNWSLNGMSFGLSRYIFFALIVSAAYTVKFIVLRICGYLFQVEKETATYIFNIFLINNAVGTLLIPLVLFIAFSSAISTTLLISISVFFIACGFLYRIIRGIIAGFSSPAFSLYYLFLYLCALEIAPLIVLIKVLNQA